MINTTSTTGTTRPSAVATPLRAGAPAAVVAPVGAARVWAATSSVEPVGSARLPQVCAVATDGGPAYAPKHSQNDAQLRASVRWSDDL